RDDSQEGVDIIRIGLKKGFDHGSREISPTDSGRPEESFPPCFGGPSIRSTNPALQFTKRILLSVWSRAFDQGPILRSLRWPEPIGPVYCSVEKLMHQRANPIHFFFQREMARVEKMELCTGNISFKEFSTLHRKHSIVFAA